MLLSGYLLVSCVPKTVERTDHGVIVRLSDTTPNNARQVCLEVLGEKIIHVSATPEKDFSDKLSLVVLPSKTKTYFTVEDREDSVLVHTAKLTAAVSRRTGNVQFRNNSGKLILAEEEGGRVFLPVEADGTKAYNVQQVFRSASDEEGFYGLGQHQSDEFNYKGKNEELFQYNTKVSVPFIVSTCGYGILWDSYSLCRFGNHHSYSQLGLARMASALRRRTVCIRRCRRSAM